jgi:polyhydroxyalkanoate synthase
MSLLNPKNAKANRFVLGASGHIAGVINPASKNKRSYWTNDKNGKTRPKTSEEWMAGATEHKGSWWPEWDAFLAQHGGEQVPAPSSAGNEKYTVIEPAPGRYVKARAE